MNETQSSLSISTKLERIAELARRHPKEALTTMAHHMDADWMLEAYRRTRKDGATGVDGQTAEQYAEGLQGRLEALLGRVKSGQYRAAYSAPSRSLVSRHGDQGFRAIVISRFAIAITDFGDGDRDRPGTQAWKP